MNPFLLLILILIFPSRAAEPQTIIPDGAWTWFNDPRAVWRAGKLYVGYVRSVDGRAALSRYDPATKHVETVWTSSFTEEDDHNNPGLLVLTDGRLMSFYARHSTDPHFVYRVHSEDERLYKTGAKVTYSNPFQLTGEAGRIYNFMRNQNFNPTFVFSDDVGTNWSPPQILIKTGMGRTRPYVKYASDGKRRIDFLYTDGHPRDVTNSLYHMYYKGGALYKTDGTFLKSLQDAPLLHDSGEHGSLIYKYDSEIPTGRAWCWDIAYQSNNHPVCVFTVQRDHVTGTNWFNDRIYYYYARWTGKSWQSRFIAHAGRPLYAAERDYAGGICLDPESPNVLYLSSNAAAPFDPTGRSTTFLNPNDRYELVRGVTHDGGLTFTWSPITTNSPLDNLRPYVPRRGSALLWLRGNYRTYTSYDCAVMMLDDHAK